MRKLLTILISLLVMLCLFAESGFSREVEFNVTGGKAKLRGGFLPFAISTCAPDIKTISVTSSSTAVTTRQIQPNESYGIVWNSDGAVQRITATYNPDKPGMHNQFWATDQIIDIDIKSTITLKPYSYTNRIIEVPVGSIVEICNSGTLNTAYVKQISGTIVTKSWGSGY